MHPGGLHRLGLDWWEDPHNADTSFARVRVRRHLLPELERHLGPGVAGALARTADLLRDDADALDALAVDLAGKATDAAGRIDVRVLADAPAALRSRVLRAAAIAAGCPPTDLTSGHVRAVDRLVTDWRGQAGLDLPGDVVAARAGDTIGLARRGVGG
jgi:tRNA(Ile)-lysidine synthase